MHQESAPEISETWLQMQLPQPSIPSLLIGAAVELTIPTKVVFRVQPFNDHTNMRACICLPDPIARLLVALGVSGKLK